MSKINLLPWRQELRKHRQQEFLAILIGVVLIAAAILVVLHLFVDAKVVDQEQSNESIKGEISKLDGQIKEVADIKKRKEDLVARMRVIQDIQGKRPVSVRIMDDFARDVPDGIYIKLFKRTEAEFEVNGVAESPTQISEFMTRLNNSPWFQNARLSSVKASDQIVSPSVDANSVSDNKRNNDFTIQFTLEIPEKIPTTSADAKIDNASDKDTTPATSAPMNNGARK
jgi:type IV pilus assembly protein PilN